MSRARTQDVDAPAKPRRIEAHGVRGMASRPWRRTFRDAAAFAAWLDHANNRESVVVYASRDADA